MTSLLKQLQNPFLKMFGSPLGIVIFGLLVGMSQTQTIHWLGLLLLFVIAIALQMIDHYFHQRLVLQNYQQTPEMILYLSEGLLLIAAILFVLTNYWILSLLLFVSIAIYHIQYFPYLMVNNFMQYLLLLVTNAIFLNVIALYNQTTSLTTSMLVELIPPFILFAGIQIELFQLKYGRGQKSSPLYHWTAIGLCITAITSGIYLALPTATYYSVEILFGLLTSALILPLFVQVASDKQRQNKINYLWAVILLFNLCYALAIIF